MNQTTLVIGGTGAMGRRVVGRLLHTGGAVRVLTRDPAAAAARSLRDLGGDRLELVRGDVADMHVLDDALSGSTRVFCNTDFFSSRSPLIEFQQGVAVLDAARQAGIDRFVWSSLDSAATLTGGRSLVPHYEAKAAVAAHINLLRTEEMMAHDEHGWYCDHVSILTTSPYFENLQSRLAPVPDPTHRSQVVFTLPLGAGKYPMVALDDIAWFAVHLLDEWHDARNRDLAIVGESLTGEQIAAAFERVTGITARYQDVPVDELRARVADVGHDYAAMFEYFQLRDVSGKDRDPARLRQIYPKLETFEEWLMRTGWNGSRQDVQRFRIPHSGPATPAGAT